MAIPSHDKQLLSAFPQPPLTTIAPLHEAHSPLPTSLDYASDFGFIPVGLELEPEHIERSPTLGSIAEEGNTIASAPVPVALPLSDPGDMELVLDNANKLYSPADTITGYISGWKPLTQMYIILEGHAKTYIRTDKAEYQDRAPLIYQVVHLKAEDQMIVPRFVMKIAPRVQSGLSKLNSSTMKGQFPRPDCSYEWPKQSNFECQDGHPLPPSMTLPSQISCNPMTRLTATADVAYSLTAIRVSLDPSTSEPIPEASCSVLVRFTTAKLSRSKLEALKRETYISSFSLSIRTRLLIHDGETSFRGYFRDAFSSSTPTFYYAAGIATPKACTPGTDLPISISSSVLPPPPGQHYNFPIPDVEISYFVCRIRSYTGIRVLCPLLSPATERVKSHVFKSWVLDQRQDPKGAIFSPNDGDFVGQKCLISVNVPKDLTPTFQTWNIWRGYKMSLEVGFQVKGREERVSLKQDLNIVAS